MADAYQNEKQLNSARNTHGNCRRHLIDGCCLPEPDHRIIPVRWNMNDLSRPGKVWRRLIHAETLRRQGLESAIA